MTKAFQRGGRRKFVALFSGIIFLTTLSPNYSAGAKVYVTADNILTFCSEGKRFGDQIDVGYYNFCLGYIGAIVAASSCDTLGVNARAISEGFRTAPPAGSTMEQVRRVVVKWLSARPELLHYDGAGMVARALSESWPCPM